MTSDVRVEVVILQPEVLEAADEPTIVALIAARRNGLARRMRKQRAALDRSEILTLSAVL